MTHRALAQEGPDLRREDISISPPRRRRHRHKGLAPSRSNAVEDSRLGRLSHWPVLPRPQLAGFQVSTEGDELSEPLHGVPPWSESSIDPCAINDLVNLALVVALPASQLSANRDVKIGLGLVPASIGETVSEHRSTTWIPLAKPRPEEHPRQRR